MGSCLRMGMRSRFGSAPRGQSGLCRMLSVSNLTLSRDTMRGFSLRKLCLPQSCVSLWNQPIWGDHTYLDTRTRKPSTEQLRYAASRMEPWRWFVCLLESSAVPEENSRSLQTYRDDFRKSIQTNTLTLNTFLASRLQL